MKTKLRLIGRKSTHTWPQPPLLMALVLWGSVATQAPSASWDVDPSFDPGSDSANSEVEFVAIVESNKTLIAGSFTLVAGRALRYVGKLNADGSADLSFHSPIYDDGHTYWYPQVHAGAVQADGKILVGGSFAGTNGTRNFVRLESDGSLDSSFRPAAFTGSEGLVDTLVLQPDGKILVAGRQDHYDKGGVVRLNSDGSLDGSFGISIGGPVYCLVPQADGKVLAGGLFTSVNGTNLLRLNADGSVDASFRPPAMVEGVYAIVLPGNGKVVFGCWQDVLGLNADGSLDPGFAPFHVDARVFSLELQEDGKIVCGSLYGTNIVRLNPDGTRDASFTATLGVSGIDSASVRDFAIGRDGQITVGGWFRRVNGVSRQAVARLHTNGSVDDSFRAGGGAIGGEVASIALQGDGKVLIAGFFSSVNSWPRNRLARLHADGSLDRSFLEGQSGANSEIRCMAIQPDNRVLIGGDFTSVNGVPRGRIARLNADGSLDHSFLNGLSGADSRVESLVIQADGQIVVAGLFRTFNLSSAEKIVRLRPDGSRDAYPARIPSFGSVSEPPHLVLQPDGKILVAGEFTVVNNRVRTNLARLQPDGSLDDTFPTQPTTEAVVSEIALQPDGKILVGGDGWIRRLNSNGSVDVSFRPSMSIPLSGLTSLAWQSDGKVMAGVGPGGIVLETRTNLFRYNADGSWDSAFLCTQSTPSLSVMCIARQTDGKVLIGGGFGAINGVIRPRLARLMGEAAPVEILTHPQSRTAEAGSTVGFSVRATGYPLPSYQWYFDTTNHLPGRTGSILELSHVQLINSGVYSVAVSNLFGGATSAPAMLSVIPPVERRPVPAINLAGEVGALLTVESADSLTPTPNWLSLETVPLTSPPQWYFDLSALLPQQRFYRAWQTGAPGVTPTLALPGVVPALKLSGAIDDKLRVDAINQIGPVDAWFTLATVTLTNTTQLYFDTTTIGQPARLYRLVPVP